MLKLRPSIASMRPAPAAAQRANAGGKSKLMAGCPICKNVPLTEKALEEGLRASNCGNCGGWWIDAAKYWQWIEMRRQSNSPQAGATALAAAQGEIIIDPASLRPVKDSGPGKFCPECGRFMSRAKPGYGLEFFVTRCGGCGGIWLDANEWENLRDAGLHDGIHFMFSDSWQANISKTERVAQYEQLLTEKLGADTMTEINRIKTWMDSHPKKTELYAFLLGGTDSK